METTFILSIIMFIFSGAFAGIIGFVIGYAFEAMQVNMGYIPFSIGFLIAALINLCIVSEAQSDKEHRKMRIAATIISLITMIYCVGAGALLLIVSL